MACIPEPETTVSTEDDDHTPHNVSRNSSTNSEDDQIAQWKLLLVSFAVLLLTIRRAYSFSESCVKAILLLSVVLIRILATVFKAKKEDIDAFLAIFPRTELALRVIAGMKSSDEDFKQFVCCAKCFQTYVELEKWHIHKYSKPEDFLCSHVKYPRHPHASRRSRCGTTLLKTVTTGCSTLLRPLKVYPYRSLVVSLKHLLMRVDMLKLCNEWVTRKSTDPQVMIDVYDGKLWKDFMNINGRPFLSQPNNLALSLNVDWFRPFQHSQYSIGVLYIVVLNLPREMRYLPENVIIAGIIPGPTEPKKTMNSLLEPLVKDLLTLWNGVHFVLSPLALPVRIRAVLFCISCDIPACRKVCGFLGHNANLACSKCTKFFNGNVQVGFDFSGYVTSSWPQRNNASHRVNAKATKVAITDTAQKELERRYGLRYSVLLELPYLDIVRQHVVDPMHNLFLGVAKHALSVWKDAKILSAGAFDKIQSTVDQIQVPSTVGRIPAKIASGFADFTADQWKNWILIYSLVALQSHLPADHLACWKIFVDACFLLCSQTLTTDAVSQAHTLIVKYCQQFQELYGNNACTINMHLTCHMAECIQDFGPLHGFWCFSFERMNGRLGAIPTNNRSVEVQLMRKFVDSMHLHSYVHAEDENVQALLRMMSQSSKRGTLSFIDRASYSEVVPHVAPVPTLTHVNPGHLVIDYVDHVTIVGTSSTAVLTTQEHAQLTLLCQDIFGNTFHQLRYLCEHFKQISLQGQTYGSTKSRYLRCAHVLAYNGTRLDCTGCGVVKMYVKAKIELNLNDVMSEREVPFALVEWFDEHPERHTLYSAPVEVWRPSVGNHAFVPVPSIVARVAVMETDSCIVVVPLLV